MQCQSDEMVDGSDIRLDATEFLISFMQSAF